MHIVCTAHLQGVPVWLRCGAVLCSVTAWLPGACCAKIARLLLTSVYFAELRQGGELPAHHAHPIHIGCGPEVTGHG